MMAARLLSGGRPLVVFRADHEAGRPRYETPDTCDSGSRGSPAPSWYRRVEDVQLCRRVKPGYHLADGVVLVRTLSTVQAPARHRGRVVGWTTVRDPGGTEEKRKKTRIKVEPL